MFIHTSAADVRMNIAEEYVRLYAPQIFIFDSKFAFKFRIGIEYTRYKRSLSY